MKKCKLLTLKRGGEKLKVSLGDKLYSHRRTVLCYDDDDDDDGKIMKTTTTMVVVVVCKSRPEIGIHKLLESMRIQYM